MRTLSSIVETEANKITDHVNSKVERILEDSRFNKEGVPQKHDITYGINERNICIDQVIIKRAQQRYNESVGDGVKIADSQCMKFYVNPKEATNISIDDVSVKKQVMHRQKNEQKSLKYVRNTVVHVENSKERYYLNALDIVLNG